MQSESTTKNIDHLYKKAKHRIGDPEKSIPLGSKVEGLEKYLGLDELLEDGDLV